MKLLKLLAALFICGGLTAQATADLFKLGNQAYRQENFDQAITYYSEALAGGEESAPLYYNLANAYYKSDQVAKAILNYERALELSPQDDDIRQNLSLAREATIDQFEELPEPIIKAAYHSLVRSLNPDTWAILAVGSGLLSVAGVFLFLFSGYKRPGFASGLGFFIIGMICWYMAWRHHHYLTTNREAIVMATSSYVKSGPGEKAEDVFILHAGTKAVITESFEGWSKIKLPDGKVGWINAGDIEQI